MPSHDVHISRVAPDQRTSARSPDRASRRAKHDWDRANGHQFSEPGTSFLDHDDVIQPASPFSHIPSAQSSIHSSSANWRPSTSTPHASPHKANISNPNGPAGFPLTPIPLQHNPPSQAHWKHKPHTPFHNTEVSADAHERRLRILTQLAWNMRAAPNPYNSIIPSHTGQVPAFFPPPPTHVRSQQAQRGIMTPHAPTRPQVYSA